MWPIVTDGVAWSVCQSVCRSWSSALHEPIEMPFGMWTWVGSRNHILHGVQIGPCDGATGEKMAGPGHGWQSIHSKVLNRGQNRYSADANWGVLDGVHIGATWWICLNSPCVVAMQPYVKLLRPLVNYWTMTVQWQTQITQTMQTSAVAVCYLHTSLYTACIHKNSSHSDTPYVCLCGIITVKFGLPLLNCHLIRAEAKCTVVLNLTKRLLFTIS